MKAKWNSKITIDLILAGVVFSSFSRWALAMEGPPGEMTRWPNILFIICLLGISPAWAQRVENKLFMSFSPA
jgi:hypothetical protein